MASGVSFSDKLRINFCRQVDLLVLPGVGQRIAEHIVHFRNAHGNITLDNIYYIPKLRPSTPMLEMIDFTPNRLISDVDPLHPPSREPRTPVDPTTERMLRVIDDHKKLHSRSRKHDVSASQKTSSPRYSDSHSIFRKTGEKSMREDLLDYLQEVREKERDKEEDDDDVRDLIRKSSRPSSKKTTRRSWRIAYSPGGTAPRHVTDDEESDEDDDSDDDRRRGKSKNRSNLKPASLPKSLKFKWQRFTFLFLHYRFKGIVSMIIMQKTAYKNSN